MAILLLFLFILILALGRVFFWAFLFGLLVVRPFTWRQRRPIRWLLALAAGALLFVVFSGQFEERHPAYLALALLLNVLMSWFYTKRRSGRKA